jgi:hypothetical protein
MDPSNLTLPVSARPAVRNFFRDYAGQANDAGTLCQVKIYKTNPFLCAMQDCTSLRP